MNIFKAYLNGWKNWKRFDGRTRRRDYWGYMLCHYGVAFLFILLFDLELLFDVAVGTEILLWILVILYAIIAIVPTLSITIRRLHDTNHSALYYLVSIVPVIGNLWFFILMCTEGTCGKNDYGLDPKEVLYDDGTSVDCGNYPDFKS